MRRALAPLVAVALLLAFALAGCDDVKTFDDPKGTIEVDKDSKFAVELQVNSGVGFDWELAAAGFGIKPTKTSTDYPDEPRAGESGTKRFEFKATSEGRKPLVFRHYFRGERKEQRKLTVVVKN